MKKENRESGNHKTVFELRKYREDIDQFKGREDEFYRLYKPYEVIKGEGNCLLIAGLYELWDLLINGGTGWAAYCQIGVGDSSTAAVSSQTDLQATSNKTYAAMMANYPVITYSGSPPNYAVTCSFKSSFGASYANYAWNEWVVKNSSNAYCLNRKVESLGTKSGGTWELLVSVTLS